MKFKKYKNNNSLIRALVLFLIFFRLILNWKIPLLDKTEARYAEIARLMYETNQWIVMQYDYGIPFWAKPPLSTWLSAISFNVFGINEFAARLPSFIIGLVIIGLLTKIKEIKKVDVFFIAFVLLTIPEFLLHMGVTSTDSTLMLSTTLVMISFWNSMIYHKKTIWNYLFFVGIGLGLLAKGPLIIVLTSVPIFIWSVLDFKNRFIYLWKKIPWITGILITILVAGPWYYFMEKESPGFFNYFIVGEHFHRFTDSEWHGDKYGFAKSQPIGMIWLFLIGFGFPWVPYVLYKMWKKKSVLFKDKWVAFLILWAFWTPLFFTFSSNAIHTYILPSLIPIGLLVANWWSYNKKWLIVSMVFPIIIVFAFIILSFKSSSLNYYLNTDKYLIESQEVSTTNKDIPIYYWMSKSYSGKFYANKETGYIYYNTTMDSILSLNKKSYFLIKKVYHVELNEENTKRLIPLDSNYRSVIFTNIIP